jgi:cell division protein DivIC
MRKIKIQLNRRPRMILTALLCGLLLFTIIPRAKTIYELSGRKQELLQEKARLTEINAERQKTLATIDSPAGMERIAREQLGMVKNGERTIIRVLDSE